jgi:hypothetical protein
MMETDDLIAKLAAELQPLRRGRTERRLALGLMAGAAGAFLVMMLWLGLRPDLSFAATTQAFRMKALYTLILVLISFFLADGAGKPGARLWPTALWLVLAFGIIAAVGGMQMMHAPRALRPAMFFGDSYAVCPWRIVVLSMPILIGVVLSLRQMAPTRPTLAGAVAGLLAGAAGATVYGLHCTESSALFVAFWYTLGIAMVGAIGAAVGRYALRW